MAGPSGFEFIHRPYPYPRAPFQLIGDERVAYEARYFSIPAFALLADKRLFTDEGSHPVTSPIVLYINKDAGLSSGIEPTLAASGYEVATPHYADYILDMRDLLDDVVALHAADSQYSADEFFSSHMQRNRAVYDLPNSSASGVTNLEYVHPAPANTVPVAPSSTVIVTTSGNTIELGALQFQDIDMDEVQWQPFTRPKTERLVSNIPVEPVFPAALPGGSLPSFSSLDEEKFGELGYGAATSGGLVITGDRLVEGTSVKLLTGSGQTGASEGAFIEGVPWKLFPAGEQLNLYYETQQSGCINASGRQAVYNVPGSLTSDAVHLLDVSDAGSSGLLVQNFPANYHSTSGLDPNNNTHPGVHVVDKLIYGLNELSPGNIAAGRSPINGKKVFGHFVGSDTNEEGESVQGKFAYADGDTVYAYAGVVTPIAGGGTSKTSWATISSQLSPVGWGNTFTSALQPRVGIFGGAPSTTWEVGDINTGDKTVWFKVYNQWGTMDRMVTPGGPRADGGDATQGTINYETHTYREGVDENGNFAWIELDPPESPTFTSQTVNYFNNTFQIGNIMSFFFNRNFGHGFVNVNGEVRIQWSQRNANGTPVLPVNNQFAALSTLNGSFKDTPPTAHSTSTYVVGFFPSWKIRLQVTTNNQIQIPDSLPLTPAGSAIITMASGLLLDIGDVNTFGPVAWDSAAGLNYLYLTDNFGNAYFAKMNTSYEIIHLNRVEVTDSILAGKAAVLSI